MQGMRMVARMLVFIVLFAVGGHLAAQAGVLPAVGATVAALLYLWALSLPSVHVPGVTCNGINTEIWTNYLDENFYKQNQFLENTMDHSEYVDNLTVHSPQAGDDGDVEVNRSVFPATVTTRTDTTVDWNIDEFTVDPWKISNAEEVQLSYNKLDSMLYSRRSILDQKIADRALYLMAPTGTATLRNAGGTNNNILRSSGVRYNDDTAPISFIPAYLPSGTGYRKSFGLYDILQAQLMFDSMDIPDDDRHLILSAKAKSNIIADIIASKYRDSISQFDTATGKISNLLGFAVHTRSSVLRYSNADVPVAKAPTAAAAADDNDAILFWHRAAIRRAMGETKVFDDADRPEYYGKLFSILKRFGATISRNDELGVGAIVQAAYVPVGA